MTNDYYEPRYDLIKYHRPRLRKFVKSLKADTKVDKYYDRRINPNRQFRKKKMR